MTPLVTEMWSVRDYQRGKSARRAWQVSGVANEEEARQAPGAQAAPGATFPLDGRLIIKDMPKAAADGGPTLYRVTAEFVLPGSGQYQVDADPLDQPPDFLWSRGTISEPSDVDAKGRVITNSAGIPFANPPSAEIPYRILTVSRNESTYDVAKSLAYEGKYNSDSVQIPMTPGPVEPGQLLCVSYEPTQAYNRTSQYVPVVYTFWLRRGHVRDADGVWDAWKHRLVDQGLMGWYNNAGLKPAAIVDNHSPPNRVPAPVLLDGTGKPLNTAFRLEGNETPVSFQTLVPELLENTGSAVYLKYLKFLPAQMSGLSLF